jgi:serine/threonine protein kinase
MTPNARWKAITESQFSWEREALEYLRERLPDHEPWRAWANFEFIADDGSVNEVDLMVLSPRGLFIIEIKSRPGVLSGDAAYWTWTDAGRRYTDDNPLPTVNRKAKKLASILRRQKSADRVQIPFIEPLVFCSAVTDVQLTGTARARLCLKDREAKGDKPERPGIVKALTERIAEGLDASRLPQIDASVARALSRSMDEAGIRPSRRSQEVRGYRMDALLAEGPAFQDRLGIHRSFESDRRRIRLFLSARGANQEARQVAARAAEREYQILRGLSHNGILKPTDYEDGEHGPAILFEYDPSAVRLDHFMRENHSKLGVDDRLSLIRQIAEAVRYAHQRRVTHRAICPQSILVLNPSSEHRHIQIFNWQVGSRESTGTSTAAAGGRTMMHSIAATSHVEQLLEDAASVYRAPEGMYGEIDGNGEHLDIFSLGSLAYFLFSGQPPAANPTDVAQLVREHSGLRLSAVIDGPNEHLQDLVQYSTQPLPSDRYATVDDFLDELTKFEDDLTTPDGDPLPDPTEAKAGDRIEHGFIVKKRMGTGSTAVALLVTQESDGAEHVLKVAHTFEQNDRLRSEAQVLQRLHHQHVVSCRRVLEFATRDGARLGVLLQNAGEITLGKKIHDDGRFQVELLERFGEDLLATLQYLEDNGVFHRDIKPENIGVSELRKGGKRHLILFDFSLASSPAEVINAGTRPYLDPFLQEKSRRKYDSHAERFAAGVTLYEMATGALPQWGSGVSDPFVIDAEVHIDGDAMDSAVREPLTKFFRKALARQVKDRFDNTEAMLKSWREVFTSAGKPVVSGVSDDGDGDGGFPALRGLDRATAATSLVELGLSTRAINALDRIDIHTVKQFLGIKLHGGIRLPGVGFKTKTELRRAHAELQSKFPEIKAKDASAVTPSSTGTEASTGGGTAHTDHEESSGIKSIDYLARRFAGKRTARATTEERVIPMLLGLEPVGIETIWPSQTDVANAIERTRAQVSQIVGKKRENWRKDSLLSEVRTEVVDLLNSKGGVMTATELAGALLATHGSASLDSVRETEAYAVLRAAVEAESDRKEEDARFVVQRNSSVGGGSGGGHIIIARCVELADYALRLAKKADALAQADPLPAPTRIVEELGRLETPVVELGMPVPDEVRRVHLAAAASASAAVNDKLEIYPRNLPAARALKLALSAVFGHGELLKVQQIKDRVRSRYPQSEPLPDMPELERMLQEIFSQARVQVRWDSKSDAGRGSFVVMRHPPPTFSSGTVIQRQNTLADAPVPSAKPVALPNEIVDAKLFEDKLQNAFKQGAYLVLTTEPRHLTQAEAELQRRFPALKLLSIESILLTHMKTIAARDEVDWSIVLTADNAEPESEDWRRLVELVGEAMPGVERDIRSAAATATVLLTYPGMLGRYRQMSLLANIQGAVGTTGGIHGAWVLLPTDQQNLPTIDSPSGGVAVPVINGQHRRVPSSWLINAHRANRQTLTPNTADTQST